MKKSELCDSCSQLLTKMFESLLNDMHSRGQKIDVDVIVRVELAKKLKLMNIKSNVKLLKGNIEKTPIGLTQVKLEKCIPKDFAIAAICVGVSVGDLVDIDSVDDESFVKLFLDFAFESGVYQQVLKRLNASDIQLTDTMIIVGEENLPILVPMLFEVSSLMHMDSLMDKNHVIYTKDDMKDWMLDAFKRFDLLSKSREVTKIFENFDEFDEDHGTEERIHELVGEKIIGKAGVTVALQLHLFEEFDIFNDESEEVLEKIVATIMNSGAFETCNDIAHIMSEKDKK